MHLSLNMFTTAACAVAMTMAAASAGAADEYRVSGPAVHDNLAVYLVHGAGAGAGAAPLTLDQALAKGAVKIHESETHPVMVENLSNQSVFIQLGDLIKGGLQDQVAGTSLLLPPHSGNMPLTTFCVDPFRSSARDGDSPKLFSSGGALFPSRLAKLGILSGFSDARAVGKIRESAVWWSIDTVRAELSQKLGEPLETPRTVHWTVNDDSRANVLLAARRSPWTTSLPLALENRRLAQAQQTFMDGFRRAGARRGDVIGAVFAIDGKVVDAEVYQSHALFMQMWPKLLRAFATEALAAGHDASDAPPSTEAVSAFLATAQQGNSHERALNDQVRLRDSEGAIYLEASGHNGKWVHRSFVAKLGPEAMPNAPEAMLVRMLETGQVDGRSLASLGDDDKIIVRDNGGNGWSTTIQSPPSEAARVLELLQRHEQERLAAGAGLGISGRIAAFLVLVFFALVIWRDVLRPALRGSIARAVRSGRAVALFPREVAARVCGVAQSWGQTWLALRAALLALLGRGMPAGRQRAYALVRLMPRLRTVPMT